MQIIFLGTGASGGTPGGGKSQRQESSILIQDEVNILIDVTRNFTEQSKWIEKIDAILITHAHMDACGGISQLRKWCIGKKLKLIPVYAHPKTLAVIANKFKVLKHCLFIPVSSNQTFKLNTYKISSLEVPHSKDPWFPTFAWKLKGAKTIIYASDIAELTPAFKEFSRDADFLIIDGATWKRKIYSHLRVDKDLSKLCSWKTEQIILTQIGKSALPHRQFQKEVAKICPKAIPAYDGLKLFL